MPPSFRFSYFFLVGNGPGTFDGGPGEMLNGIVVEEWKNYYVVDADRGRFRAVPQGALRKKPGRLCVGDRVEMRVMNADTREGLIVGTLPRRTFLPRPPMANMDQLIFVNTVREPVVSFETIDRFLLNAELHELVTVIVINKADLFDREDTAAAETMRTVYERIGYPVLTASARSGEGIDEIVKRCAGKISCVAGVSGVGKSSLLHRIFPEREFRTGELSEKLERGVHTTTHTILLRHERGGYIADTPGFAFIELPRIDTDDLIACFPEINEAGTRCRFGDCRHLDEPDCAVRRAVENGTIAASRYTNYAKFYEAIETMRKKYKGKRR